jgi:hypothetical protein
LRQRQGEAIAGEIDRLLDRQFLRCIAGAFRENSADGLP